MTMTQIQYAAVKRNQSFKPVKPHDFKVGDLVLVKNHMSKAFQEKYQGSYQVVRLLGKNQLEVKDQNNLMRQVHVTDVKKTTMPEVIVKAIPDYKQFGRAAKLRLNPSHIKDLEWEIHEQLPALCPETEVSELTEVVPRAVSQDTTTPSGESFMTTDQFHGSQSLTDQLKEELSQ